MRYSNEKTSGEISCALKSAYNVKIPPKIIDKYLYTYDYRKNIYYRWPGYAYERICREIYQLKQMYERYKEEENLKKQASNKKNRNSIYKNKQTSSDSSIDPRYSGWNKGISQVSQELIDNDNPNPLNNENKSSKRTIRERLRRIDMLIENVNNKVNLMHGSFKDFDKFDLKYLNSGWGNQAFGYGLYFTTSEECAKEYARGGIIYHAEISGNKFLTYDKTPSKRESMSIAKKFFKYYTTEDEYGKDAYKGCEQEFWDYECIYIAQCQDEGSIYGTISSILGSDKEASACLNKIGYTGLIAHDEQGFDIYVIFNDKDIKITRKEKK